jgi:hypothetical protein
MLHMNAASECDPVSVADRNLAAKRNPSDTIVPCRNLAEQQKLCNAGASDDTIRTAGIVVMLSFVSNQRVTYQCR